MSTSPVVETPAVETPVVETPAVETPVVEAPVVEAPVVEAPVVETPVVEAQVVEAPVVEDIEEIIAELRLSMNKIERNKVKVTELENHMKVLAGQGFNVESSMDSLIAQRSEFDNCSVDVVKELKLVAKQANEVASKLNC